MSIRTPFFLATALFALAAPQAFSSDWPKSSDEPLVVTDAPEEQAQAKIEPLPDGGYYVAWFDGQGGYDVRLQHYSAKGKALWPEDGILVADRDLLGTTDYGLDHDADGNAVLAYRVRDADGSHQIAVMKIRPDGSPAWAGEVLLTSTLGNSLQPKVAATEDGGMVVTWGMPNGSLGAQKLDAAGTPMWDSNREVVPPAGAFFLSADLQPAGDGGVIYSVVAQGRFFGSQLWAQKLDADGQPLWGAEPLKIWDDIATGGLPRGYFPKLIPDGAGGAVFCWNYSFGVAGAQSNAQHVRADGSELFAHGGVALSVDTGRSRDQVACTYNRASGDIYAVWRERNPSQGSYGISAQRLNADGAPLWGPFGMVILPESPTQTAAVIALPKDDGVVAAWMLTSVQETETLQAAAVTSDGISAWTGGIATLRQGVSQFVRLEGATGSDGRAVFLWEDHPIEAEDQRDLLMTSLGRDGLFGKKDK